MYIGTRTSHDRVSRLTHLLFLTIRKNLKSLMDVPGKWIDRAAQRRSLDKLILDLDSSVSETYERPERLGDRRAAEGQPFAGPC